mmetsp:Transcript_2900/g.6266  ORF Transcript_2900/g.6266 Transcript_2900/m.6266 type:complete len:460 (-) Transcript_2900:32-1411(-)
MDNVGVRDAFRVWWVDYCGVTRMRVIPAARVLRGVKGGDPVQLALTPACMGMPAIADLPPRDSPLTAVGEVGFTPDWSSLRQAITALPHSTGDSSEAGAKRMLFVPGDFSELDLSLEDKAAAREPWNHCSRSILRRALGELKDRTGVSMKMGFETEFVLYENGGEHQKPLGGDLTYCAAEKYAVASEFLECVVETLAVAGINTEQMHAESAPGQYEISTQYSDAMVAADECVLTRALIAAVAVENGLRASFSPKPFASQAGQGAHVHFSLWRDGLNQWRRRNWDELSLTNSFLAGILHSAPALTAVCSSSPLSFQRLVPNSWSGTWQAYGAYNRECALRLIPHEGHAEYKAIDPSANPYLAAASIAAAGTNGIIHKMPLRPPTTTNPAALIGTDAELSRLPTNLETALAALCTQAPGEPLRNLFGPAVVDAFCCVKRFEHELAANLTPHELQSKYRFRY